MLGQYISENITAGREGGMPILRIHASIFTPLKQKGGMMFSSSSSTEELKNVFDSSFTALFVKRAFAHSINSVPSLPSTFFIEFSFILQNNANTIEALSQVKMKWSYLKVTSLSVLISLEFWMITYFIKKKSCFWLIVLFV